MAAVRLLIAGIVQGVGYRDWAVRTAKELGVTGWVRNLFDDRVEIWAEGSAEALAALRERCHRGPRLADVTSVTADPALSTGAATFERRSTGADPVTLPR